MDYESSESRQLRYMGLGDKSPAEIARLKQEVPWLFKDYRPRGNVDAVRPDTKHCDPPPPLVSGDSFPVGSDADLWIWHDPPPTGN